MKKINYLLLTLLLFAGLGRALADEGMWLPMFIDRLNYIDMQKLGLQLTPDEIYSVNHASLKDAVVGLADSPNPSGYFCTAEIVSPQGLMFTNYHCGFESIQKHSSVSNDYLEEGFWATNRDEELPNEGLTASILVRMADVTDSIIPFLNDTMTESARSAAVGKISGRLKKAASEKGKYNVNVKSFFQGNEYYMFVYIVYKDVRLVGAPPSSIGKFGGDTDNWMWPRQTGDFSVFRIYTAPDGSPAEYSKDNVPLKPKYHLSISLNGIKKGDFTMIMGFPGRTDRYATASDVQFRLDYYYPPLIEVLGDKLSIWKKHMDADKNVKIKYATQYATTANGWKNFIGQSKDIKDLNVVGQKIAFEEKFQTWVENNPVQEEKYGDVLREISDIYQNRTSDIGPLIYASLTGIGGSGIIQFAQSFSGLQGLLEQYKKEKDKDKKIKKEAQIKKVAEDLKKSALEHFKDYDMATDRDVFSAMTKIYYNKVPNTLHPEVLDKEVKKHKEDFNAYADYVFAGSFLSDRQRTLVFLNDPDLKAIDKDPAFKLMQGYMGKIMAASVKYKKNSDQLSRDKRLYVQAIRKMMPGKKFYPDANSTLRLSFGTVEDYYPADAVHYDYKTHLSGVMQKENPDNDEFIVPEKLKELYETKDYGPYADADGTMVVCFLTNNDITGGNSGSPVMNAKGELIGLAFDGNWEAMSSNIAYAPKLQRTIVVDIRYVLFIIDKFAGAGNLVDELTIHKSVPQPVRIEQTLQPETEGASVN